MFIFTLSPSTAPDKVLSLSGQYVGDLNTENRNQKLIVTAKPDPFNQESFNFIAFVSTNSPNSLVGISSKGSVFYSPGGQGFLAMGPKDPVKLPNEGEASPAVIDRWYPTRSAMAFGLYKVSANKYNIVFHSDSTHTSSLSYDPDLDLVRFLASNTKPSNEIWIINIYHTDI